MLSGCDPATSRRHIEESADGISGPSSERFPRANHRDHGLRSAAIYVNVADVFGRMGFQARPLQHETVSRCLFLDVTNGELQRHTCEDALRRNGRAWKPLL